MKNKKNLTNQIRIIGGQWRGRKLTFFDSEGLRPTTDRVRETLFNWLQPHIMGSRCLDLFSGSGALGLEALSREASEVWLVEQNPAIAQHLKQQLSLLNDHKGRVQCGDATALLKQSPDSPFEIVFVDPPFRKGLLEECCQLLEANQWLEDEALIYLESEQEIGIPQLPDNWEIIRSKKAGQVGYHLAIRHQQGPDL